MGSWKEPVSPPKLACPPLLVPLLLISAAGANSCSLKIHPATVVVRHGDPVTVNCSVNNTDHDGMGWVAQQGSVGLTEDVQFLLWSVRNLTAWDIKPQCYANVRNSPTQCTDQVSVTVYKPPDSISINSMGHTDFIIEGKQSQLMCAVHNIAPVQNLVVRWYKGIKLINETHFTETTKTPLNKSSNIMINPTGSDDGAQYSCVAELNLGREGPRPPVQRRSESFRINVHHAPSFLQPTSEMVMVKRGENVTLNCTASGNPPPTYSWSSSHPQTPVITFIPELSENHTCTAANKYGEKTKHFTIQQERNEYLLPTIIGIGVCVAIFLIIGYIIYRRRMRRQNAVI